MKARGGKFVKETPFPYHETMVDSSVLHSICMNMKFFNTWLFDNYAK